jgi:DNA-binding MarR family transcriptional regulator
MSDYPSLPFSGRSPVARACSIRAAREAASDFGRKTGLVLTALRAEGSRGLTRHDLASLTGYQTSSLCSIVDALVHAGLVAEQGSRKSGKFGRECCIYVAAECKTGAAA